MKRREERIALRLSSAGLALIDDKRGAWTRSEYVRRAVMLAIKENLRGPTLKDDL